MLRVLVVLSVLVIAIGVASAQSAVSARSQGMGSSSLASLGESEAIFLNPAALPWLRRATVGEGDSAWGGQAVLAAGGANVSNTALDVDDLSTFLVGAGATNGRHGFCAYYADLDVLMNVGSETGLGYGFSFARDWSFGAMLRFLDRPERGDDIQVTDFSLHHNWSLGEGRPLSVTFIVRDPYGHTDVGMTCDLAAAAYISRNLLCTALAQDLGDKDYRTLNVGAEAQVRPGWFVRTGFEETPHKDPSGMSVGVGHRRGNWQFDVAVTRWRASSSLDMGVGVTGGASVIF